MDDTSDERNDDCDNRGDVKLESPRDRACPAEMRVRSAEDALGEDNVDDEEDHNAGGYEDLGCDGDGDVVRVLGPDQAHGAGRDTRHAETEEHAAHDEFLTTAQVDLEDGHVAYCSQKEKDQEDGCNGDIWDVSGCEA